MIYVQFNRFEVAIPSQDAVDDIAQSGDNAAAVDAHIGAFIAANVKIPIHRIVEELREYGAWSKADLSNPVENWRRLLWIAAWNYYDNPEPTETNGTD